MLDMIRDQVIIRRIAGEITDRGLSQPSFHSNHGLRPIAARLLTGADACVFTSSRGHGANKQKCLLPGSLPINLTGKVASKLLSRNSREQGDMFEADRYGRPLSSVEGRGWKEPYMTFELHWRSREGSRS